MPYVLRLVSSDDTNRLTRSRVLALTAAVEQLAERISRRDWSSPATRISSRPGPISPKSPRSPEPEAFHFAHMGQRLMNAVASFPAPTIAAVHGYCMGGGLDLALACRRRIAGPHALFGHRGAALGLITGWGGTQRLPRLVGKGRHCRCSLRRRKCMHRRL